MKSLSYGIGFVLLAIGLFRLNENWSFVRSAERTQGTLIELQGSLMKVQFTHGGSTYIAEGHLGRRSRMYAKINDLYPVLFAPQNPSHALVDQFWNLWGWSLILLGAGAGIPLSIIFSKKSSP